MNHQELAATVRNVLAHSYDEDALAALDSLVEQLQASLHEGYSAEHWHREYVEACKSLKKRVHQGAEAVRRERGLREQLSSARGTLLNIASADWDNDNAAEVLDELQILAAQAVEGPNPAREPINFGGFNAMTDPLSPPVFGASAIPSAASPEGNDGAAGGESSPASSPKEGA